MHVHVPKPLHGWKAFFNEIFVIVIGVLIALALESQVEAAHWLHKVEDGEARLKVELGMFYRISVEQMASTPCVMGQLDNLENRVLASGQRLDPAPMMPIAANLAFTSAPGNVIDTSARAMTPSVWNALAADGTALHMPVKLQRRLGVLYSAVETYRDSRMNRHQLWDLTRPLPLDPITRHALIAEIDAQRETTLRMANMAAQIAGGIRDVGFAPNAAVVDAYLHNDLRKRETACVQQGRPFADWRAALAGTETYDQIGI